jgi:hypothetical protein
VAVPGTNSLAWPTEVCGALRLTAGRATAQAVGPPPTPRRPVFDPRSGRVGFVADKTDANSHSTECSTHTSAIRHWYNMPTSGTERPIPRTTLGINAVLLRAGLC